MGIAIKPGMVYIDNDVYHQICYILIDKNPNSNLVLRRLLKTNYIRHYLSYTFFITEQFSFIRLKDLFKITVIHFLPNGLYVIKS